MSRSIKIVKINDSLCLLRAVIIAIECLKKENFRNLIARPNSRDFMNRLKQLSEATGIVTGPCGIDEIRLIEDYLEEFQIMVID